MLAGMSIEQERRRAASPPVAERRPHRIVAHGDVRIDDWYWVRDRDDPDLMPLLEAENAFTEAATSHLEGLSATIYGEILSHTQLTDVTYPAPRGEWAYYTRTIGALEYPIECRRPRAAPLPHVADTVPADPDEQVVLDENALAEGLSYLDVGDRELSPDQRLLAYAVDTTGGELMTVRIRDLARGTDLPDEIEGAYYGLAFATDNTLFYVRPQEKTMRPHQVWRHRLGTPRAEDELVYEEPDERFDVLLRTSKDGTLILIASTSTSTSEWHSLPTDDPSSAPRLVVERRTGVLYELEHRQGELVILANDEAVNFALYAAPLDSPGRENWRTLRSGREDVLLESLDVIADHLLLAERGHATTTVRILDPDGAEVGLIDAPDAGTVALADNIEFETTRVRYTTTTLVDPPALYELDLATDETTLLRRQPVPGYDPDEYESARRWATAPDGTEVPLTLVWRRDRPTGPGPALLHGYGAYGSSSDPEFPCGRPIHPLLDRGVLFAIAHVRGGEELGRGWYLDGRLENKHHSFEDFVAAAHFLVAEGYTTAPELAAHGGSAGGLLMGASVNLDPTAFGAVVAAVPFVDVVTTMLDPSIPLTAHEWEEWGDPIGSREAYEWMKAYSPYDNVAPGRYPAMLVTAGISDPRVGYFEPVKWVQKLRAADPDGAWRILLRIELSAGHFGPSGRYEGWRKWAFEAAFILDAIGADGRKT